MVVKHNNQQENVLVEEERKLDVEEPNVERPNVEKQNVEKIKKERNLAEENIDNNLK